jgi:glycosyltransferase involved in cell wall biosynthesis
MLEALACGLPIVASDIPAHRELIEEGRNGLLVPPYNPSALAGALTVLGLDASLKERMAQENARKVKDYDWRTLYARLEGLGSG